MTGIITRVDPLRPSRQPGGDPYHLVIIQLEDGTSAKSYLCPSYKNFPRWFQVMHEGQRVGGLTMRKSLTVDADSPVYAI